MKRTVIYSLIISFVSSIIFFIITYILNNEIVAAWKTAVAFPAFFVVYLALILILNLVKPVTKVGKDNESLKNIDYTFPEIGEDES